MNPIFSIRNHEMLLSIRENSAKISNEDVTIIEMECDLAIAGEWEADETTNQSSKAPLKMAALPERKSHLASLSLINQNKAKSKQIVFSPKAARGGPKGSS